MGKVIKITTISASDEDEGIFRGTNPCKGCAYFEECKEHLLACRAFESFVDLNYYLIKERKDPTHGKYNTIFRDDDLFLHKWEHSDGSEE
jgi:hypothetical protein